MAIGFLINIFLTFFVSASASKLHNLGYPHKYEYETIFNMPTTVKSASHRRHLTYTQKIGKDGLSVSELEEMRKARIAKFQPQENREKPKSQETTEVVGLSPDLCDMHDEEAMASAQVGCSVSTNTNHIEISDSLPKDSKDHAKVFFEPDARLDLINKESTESVCCICTSSNDDGSLLYTLPCCGQNLHLLCMKDLGDAHSENVRCPLCRSSFPNPVKGTEPITATKTLENGDQGSYKITPSELTRMKRSIKLGVHFIKLAKSKIHDENIYSRYLWHILTSPDYRLHDKRKTIQEQYSYYDPRDLSMTDSSRLYQWCSSIMPNIPVMNVAAFDLFVSGIFQNVNSYESLLENFYTDNEGTPSSERTSHLRSELIVYAKIDKSDSSRGGGAPNVKQTRSNCIEELIKIQHSISRTDWSRRNVKEYLYDLYDCRTEMNENGHYDRRIEKVIIFTKSELDKRKLQKEKAQRLKDDALRGEKEASRLRQGRTRVAAMALADELVEESSEIADMTSKQLREYLEEVQACYEDHHSKRLKRIIRAVRDELYYRRNDTENHSVYSSGSINSGFRRLSYNTVQLDRFVERNNLYAESYSFSNRKSKRVLSMIECGLQSLEIEESKDTIQIQQVQLRHDLVNVNHRCNNLITNKKKSRKLNGRKLRLSTLHRNLQLFTRIERNRQNEWQIKCSTKIILSDKYCDKDNEIERRVTNNRLRYVIERDIDREAKRYS